MPVLFLYTQKNLSPTRGGPYSALGPFGGEGWDTGPTAWGPRRAHVRKGGRPLLHARPKFSPDGGLQTGCTHPSGVTHGCPVTPLMPIPG